MAKIKEVSSYNGSSWDTPVPLGVNDANVDITSSTQNPSSDTTSTSAGLVDSNVTVSSGDTGASAWTKFNRFRKRVQNAFGNFAGVTLRTAYSTANTNTSIYTTGVINNYMNNVIGLTGTSTPTINGSAQTVVKALSSLNNNIIRPNLLDNWYFGDSVINQRGQTAYSGVGYTLDRWNLTTDGRFGQSSTGTGGWRIGSSSGISTVKQILPKVINQPVTLSVYVPYLASSSSINLLIQKSNNNYYPALAINETGVHSLTVDGDCAAVVMQTSQSQFVDVLAIKLELGDTQTLAHKNSSGTWVLNEIPNEAEQKARCQKYFWKGGQYERFRADLIATNSIHFSIPLPVTMSRNPDLSGNMLVESVGGTAQTGFTFSVLYLASNCIGISATKTSHGLTDAVLRLNSEAFSAEL